MKRVLLSVFFLCFCIYAFAIDYYSQLEQTDPNSFTSWNTNPVGGGTFPISFTNPGDKFIIQSGHSMTTSGIWIIGATGSILEIQNDAVLQGDHSIILTGTFQIDDGGSYIHNNDQSVAQGAGSSIFSGVESFAANSNFEIRNWSDNIVGLPNSGSGITWGNLIINLQYDLGGTWSWNVANNGIINIAGNLDIRSTYSGTFHELRMVGNVGVATINIGGSLLISGTTSYVAIKKNSAAPLDGTAIVQVNGVLNVGVNTTLEITGNTASNGAGAKLSFKGNLINAGTIITNGGIGTINDLELNGTSNQDITNTGTLSGANLKFIMNGAKATLKSPLTLPGNLSLQNGKIKTTSAFILEMIRNATYTTNLANPELSFIEGPMRKIGDEDFTFPIGIGQIYAPITFNNTSSSSATDVFTAEYIRSNPQSVSTIYGSTTGIDHISYVEYWTLNQDVGASVKSIALTVNAESFCKDLDNTFISRYDPVNGWSNEGGQVLGVPSYSGPYQMATLRVTNNNISSFGYFTLATNEPFADNPLPINLISFDAKKTGTKNSLLNWELAACCSKEAKFEIQKGEDSRNFKTIAVINGSETNRFYSLVDNNLKTGISYYRLKMTDIDGSVVYSRIAAVLNGIKGLFISMSPTVVNDKAVISFTSSTEQQFDIVLTDIMGRAIRRMHQHVTEGNSNLDLALNNLTPGVYQLAFTAANGSRDVLRFIKQ